MKSQGERKGILVIRHVGEGYVALWIYGILNPVLLQIRDALTEHPEQRGIVIVYFGAHECRAFLKPFFQRPIFKTN